MAKESKANRIVNWHIAHGRGLKEATKTLGNFLELIDASVSRPVKILEIDCRFAQSLVELKQRFGDRVELYGLNRSPTDGNSDVSIEVAKYRNIADPTKPVNASDIRIAYCEWDVEIPFEEGYFDIVFCVMGFVYARNKAAMLQEIHRVLAPRGVARVLPLINRGELDSSLISRPTMTEPYSMSWVIRDKDRSIDVHEYLSKFPDIKFSGVEPTSFLEIRKTGPLHLNLTLVHSDDLHKLQPSWFGVRSEFELALR